MLGIRRQKDPGFKQSEIKVDDFVRTMEEQSLPSNTQYVMLEEKDSELHFHQFSMTAGQIFANTDNGSLKRYLYFYQYSIYVL